MSSELTHVDHGARAETTRSGDSVAERIAPAREVLGRKWHPVIVYYLLGADSPGFSDLKSRIDGISSKVLSESLEDLTEKGLVTRRILSEEPVRVEYGLTHRGKELESLVRGMLAWSERTPREAPPSGGTEDRGVPAEEPPPRSEVE